MFIRADAGHFENLLNWILQPSFKWMNELINIAEAVLVLDRSPTDLIFTLFEVYSDSRTALHWNQRDYWWQVPKQAT